MTKLFERSLFTTTASPVVLGLALAMASPAFAQTTTTEPTTDPVAADQSNAAPQAAGVADQDTTTPGQEVIVKGFRAALRSATAKKKTSETIVESVSAEDIGKLPDNGIGESIARLPGISSQRNNGRANIISIRGFGPDFSTTTLNGRQQTTTNDSRAVEFDQYPSEILAGVDVYKSSAADLTAGGLVGSINLRTIRPLDAGRRIIAVGARGTYVDQKLNPKSSDKGYRVFGTYVDQFADGDVGLALSAAYSDEPYQTKDWNAWGYGGYPGGAQGMNGVKSWFESDKLKRFGMNGTIQARVNDNFTMSFDGFYSHFTDNIDQRGFEMPFNCGGYCGADSILSSTSEGGIVTSATIAGTPIIENYASDRKANQYSFGWNGAWNNHNGTRAMLDLSWSKTKRTDDRLETIAGLRRGVNGPDGKFIYPPTAIVSYTVTDHGPVFVSDYDGTNPALVLTDVEGWSGATNQAGYDKIRKTDDDLKEARFEVEHDLSGFMKSFKVGVDYTDRDKVLTQDEAFLVPPNGADFATIPTDILIGTVHLDRGLGDIIAYDPRVLVDQGILDYVPNSFGQNAGYHVREKVWTPYAMLNLNGDLGAVNLTGNIGVQGIHTSLASSSLNFGTIKDSYWMVLPSLNLNFRFPNDFVIRFAASKQMMRPRLPDLNNVINFGPDTTRTPVIYSGGGGNPYLRPYQAKAIDLNFEKYFGTRGYLALQTFYKHMDKYIANGFNDNFDYSGLPVPPGVVPSTPVGIFFGNVNTSGGYIYGAELAGTLPFDVFSPALDGFGITGGAGYTKTKVKDFNGNSSEIPGYSKWVGSLTAFYEKNGINVRGSMRYRSGFIGDFALFSGGLDRQHVLTETVFDAQVGYDFQPGSALEGLSVFLQGQNLTDERSATISIADQPDSWLKYQSYGRRFLAGFTYKFGGRTAAPVAAPAVLPPPPPPPAPELPASQTCADGSVIEATAICPTPPPPPPPAGERGW